MFLKLEVYLSGFEFIDVSWGMLQMFTIWFVMSHNILPPVVALMSGMGQ